MCWSWLISLSRPFIIKSRWSLNHSALFPVTVRALRSRFMVQPEDRWVGLLVKIDCKVRRDLWLKQHIKKNQNLNLWGATFVFLIVVSTFCGKRSTHYLCGEDRGSFKSQVGVNQHVLSSQVQLPGASGFNQSVITLHLFQRFMINVAITVRIQWFSADYSWTIPWSGMQCKTMKRRFSWNHQCLLYFKEYKLKIITAEH